MSTTINFPQETIKRGYSFPMGQRYTYDYDPSRGFSTVTAYKGISQTELIALQQSIIAQGIACRLELYEDIGELHVDDSTLQYTIDSWEIVGSDESVDGLSHPLMTHLYYKYSTLGLQAYLRASLESNISDVAVFNYLNPVTRPESPLTITEATQIRAFYVLQQSGSTNYRSAQYVLRHKTNVSNRWQANVSDVGVENIYTPAQLLTEVTSSGSWIFPLPDRLQYKIAAIPPQGPVTNYLWGWLKSTSTESNIANNRVDITTEYTLALWSVQPNGYYVAFNGMYNTTPYY